MRKITIIFILMQLLRFPSLHAQYQNEQVLEKSFEKTKIFFQPSYLNPYGIDHFGNVAVGLLDETLLNLQLNPACVVADTFRHQFMYVDFRNSQKAEDNTLYYPLYYGAAYPETNYISYPYYYSKTRAVVEPVFSGAWFFRPFQNPAKWTIGVTYQLVSRDDPFYQVPQDIYRANVGYDYSGQYIAEGAMLSMVDRYAGRDEMHEEGQFFNLFSGLKVTSRIEAGLRLSRVTFDRQGVLANDNVWTDVWYSDYYSNESYLLERSQSYRHWDISGGVRMTIQPSMQVGFTGGLLKGRADQKQIMKQNSLYTYGTENESAEWSRYYQWGDQDQLWDHDGHNLYGGIQFRMRMSPKNDLLLSYQVMREDVAITLNSNIADSSYSHYYYADEWYFNHDLYVSSLSDIRTGSGDRKGWRHHVKIGTHMQISSKTDLFFGFQYQTENIKTETDETVIAYYYHDYECQRSDFARADDYSVQEKKTLSWNFATGQHSIFIPIVLKHRISKALGIVFGINRQLTNWEITDQTTAWFDYQHVTSDGVQESRTDFGERYTLPKEKRSDTSTMILGGLIIHPSRQFQIRLVMMPRWEQTVSGTEFEEFQWWIHFNLTQ